MNFPTNKLKSKYNLLLCVNILLIFIFLGVSQKEVKAQSPVRFLSGTTHLGGYHIKCHGQNSGVIDATPSFGTAPYTFLWNTGDTAAKLTNKPAGIYFVTAKDVNNVSRSDTFELKQPYSLNYQSSLSNHYGYNVRKHGDSDGTIELTSNGGLPPYKYQWNNGDSVAKINNLTAGNYSFIITDANQCSTNGNITLTEPSTVQFSFSNIQNATCFKKKDGSVNLNISGGLGNFVWFGITGALA